MNTAKDYRIGNYVQYDGRVFQIETIALLYPTLNTNEFGIGVVDWNNLKPIPITEEWLLQNGFDYFTSFDGDGCEFYNYKLKCVCVFNSEYSDKWNVIITDNEWQQFQLEYNIEYVHEIQNLFYALTKEEIL
jgi:hypothetical protein